jgi:hypothetical protein
MEAMMRRFVMAVMVCAVALSATISAQQSRSIADIVTDLEKLVAELRDRHQTILVNAGESVQTAINAARPGDTILLLPGVRYVGPLTLPAQTGAVTIKSAAQLPDRRIGPADAALLPILASGNLGPAITGTAATNWTLDGIAVESRTDGLGDVIVLQDAQHVTFDRLLLVAGANGQKRAIRGNGQDITLTRSYHREHLAHRGRTAQAFCAWDGAGPYTITDNYLEAASENVMFGGADTRRARSASRPTSLVDREHCSPRTRRLETGATGDRLRQRRQEPARVEGGQAPWSSSRKHTCSSGCWTDAQTGYALSIKSVNQERTTPRRDPRRSGPHGPSTEDVLVRK